MTTRLSARRLACVPGLLLLFGLSGCAVPPDGPTVVAGATTIQELTQRYQQAFNAFDLDALADCWHVPGWASTGKTNEVLLRRADVKTLYKDLLDRLQSEGFDHSELVSEEVEMVNDGCAVWRIGFTRWKKDGSFMPPRVHHAVNTLFLREGRWAFATLALDHRPAAEAADAAASAMDLGAFSVSLAVEDLAAAQAFYEKLGFRAVGGQPAQNWAIVRNGTTTIGLFQGMFKGNILTFNPGWSYLAENLESFTDVRELQKRLKASGVPLLNQADESGTGPASFVLADPDGNVIMFDQHR